MHLVGNAGGKVRRFIGTDFRHRDFKARASLFAVFVGGGAGVGGGHIRGSHMRA